MAENNFNYFQAMNNPQFASQQLQIAQQQALAQKMMEEGGQQEDPYHLANPGGFVVPVSPIAAGAKALEKGLGGYMSGKALAAQMQSYQDLHDQQVRGQDMYGSATDAAIGNQVGPATAQDVANQYGPKLGAAMSGNATQGYSPQEISTLMMDPTGGMAKAEYEQRMKLQNAGAIKAAETSNTPYQTPQGTYQMGSQIMGTPAQSGPALPPSLQQGISNQSSQPPAMALPAPKTSTPESPPDKAAQVDSLYGPGAERTPAQPVNITREAGQGDVPIAADGKPLFSGVTKMPLPDPTGNPTWTPSKTTTDVNQVKLNQEDLQKGNAGFASAAQTLGQQKAILKNLTDIYTGTQSGTLTMQHPEWINKLVAAGIVTDPAAIHSVADAQAAINNHILGAIGQIKDANANMDGNPTRTFGAEINAILDKGQNQTNQPEALWKTIGEANGLIDHHLDLINSWQKAGASGNRLNSGTTMLPNQFVQKFNGEHPIGGYQDKAFESMPKFKGMEGGDANTATSKVINGVTYTKINGQWHQ